MKPYGKIKPQMIVWGCLWCMETKEFVETSHLFNKRTNRHPLREFLSKELWEVRGKPAHTHGLFYSILEGLRRYCALENEHLDCYTLEKLGFDPAVGQWATA